MVGRISETAKLRRIVARAEKAKKDTKSVRITGIQAKTPIMLKRDWSQ